MIHGLNLRNSAIYIATVAILRVLLPSNAQSGPSTSKAFGSWLGLKPCVD